MGTQAFGDAFISRAKRQSQRATPKRSVDTETPQNAAFESLHLGSADAASTGATNAKGGTVEGKLVGI